VNLIDMDKKFINFKKVFIDGSKDPITGVTYRCCNSQPED